MLKRFEKSINSILAKIEVARKNPYKDVQKWLSIQETLIEKIIYVEERIRSNKAQIKNLQAHRKNPSVKIPKDESKEIKAELKYLEYQIDEYHFILEVYRSLGDAIAFTFINKYDIKPLNFKESAGFISKKEGLKLEKRILRYALNHGVVAILNDITSVLKYADIMLVKHDIPFPIEVKSSGTVNNRKLRQSEKAQKIFKYLSDDTADELYDISGNFKRVPLQSPEVTYADTLSVLIEKAKISGVASQLMEEGLSYFVAYEELGIEQLGAINKSFKTPVPFILNMNKFLGQAYYPFSLSLLKYYMDFLAGRMVIVITVDFEVINKISRENGFEVEYLDDPDMCFNFISKNENREISSFMVSRHYFQRIFMEFLSLKGMLLESFNRPFL